MKSIFRFTSLLLLIIITVIVLVNISNTISLETSFFSLRANVGFLILLSAILGSVATMLLLLSISSRAKQKEMKRQLEKEKLNFEVESEKVKQLEAKVKTLEEAIKIATKNK